MSLEELVGQALAGNQRSLARTATILEQQSSEAVAIRDLLRGKGGNSHIVGITGAPGVGKSTLISRVVQLLSASGKSVAIIAIDPTSPLTGGATLGDRIRMSEVALHPSVFLRSLASRTRLDALAPSALDMIRLFDASGYNYVFLETVGSGQNQFEVANYVHTLVLVESPGAGDSVQMLKAGIMEMADIYAINKADLPGAQLVCRELRSMLSMGNSSEEGWEPRIVLCSSATGDGFKNLIMAMDEHFAHLDSSGLREARNLVLARTETMNAVHHLVSTLLDEHRQIVQAVATGELTSNDAAIQLVSKLSQMPVTDH